MARQTDTDWIIEGAQVAVYSTGHRGTRVRFCKVERLTKTQIVMADGIRYRRDTLRPVGDSASEWRTETTELLPVTDPRVIDARAAARMRNLAATIQPKLGQVTTLDQALEALTQIEIAVADTRRRVEALGE
jgi:hypothetical protein